MNVAANCGNPEADKGPGGGMIDQRYPDGFIAPDRQLTAAEMQRPYQMPLEMSHQIALMQMQQQQTDQDQRAWDIITYGQPRLKLLQSRS